MFVNFCIFIHINIIVSWLVLDLSRCLQVSLRTLKNYDSKAIPSKTLLEKITLCDLCFFTIIAIYPVTVQVGKMMKLR